MSNFQQTGDEEPKPCEGLNSTLLMHVKLIIAPHNVGQIVKGLPSSFGFNDNCKIFPRQK